MFLCAGWVHLPVTEQDDQQSGRVLWPHCRPPGCLIHGHHPPRCQGGFGTCYQAGVQSRRASCLHTPCGRLFASGTHCTRRPPACHHLVHCKHCFQACWHVLGKLAQARCSSCTLQPTVLLQVQLHLQVNGVYQVKNQLLRKLYLQVMQLRRQFQVFSISHVLRWVSQRRAMFSFHYLRSLHFHCAELRTRLQMSSQTEPWMVRAGLGCVTLR